MGETDLSSIFQPLSLGTAYPTATGYKIPGGNDFNQIFAAYPGKPVSVFVGSGTTNFRSI